VQIGIKLLKYQHLRVAANRFWKM